MKKLLVGAFFLVLCVPITIHAATASELRAQIEAILAQIAFLQQQTTTALPVSVPSTYQQPTYIQPVSNNTGTFQYSRCPDLQYNLERGDTDAQKAVEITMLQRFLAQDTTLYPEAQVTGFYGPATERAVQRFQVRHGIVSYGDYQATGYGRVGPRTRWAIKNSCGTQTQPFEVAPTVGVAPLRVSVAFSGDGSTCTSYAIDWGDGTAPAVYNAPTPNACSTDHFERTATHTYTTAGTFFIGVRMGRTNALTAPLLGSVPVSVSGAVVQPHTPVIPAVSNDDFLNCFVAPTSGSAPLASRARIILGGSLCDGQFSYQVDWGDGALSEARNCSSEVDHYDTFNHTYTTNGTYTARLLQSHPQARFSEESCTVTVSQAGTGVVGSVGQTAPPTCLQWYDGCNSCSRSYTYGPAVCTQRYCTQYSALQCYQYASGATDTGVVQNDTVYVQNRASGTTAETITFNTRINGARSCDGGVYTIDFGDGAYDQQPYPADACRAFERTVSHTYTTNGFYTVRLIKNSVIQATLQVQVSTIVAEASRTSVASVFQAIIGIVESFIR